MASKKDENSHRPYGVAPQGFRLPDHTRVGAAHLQIADLNRSIDYYTGFLGLHPLERSSGAAVLGVQDTQRPLVHLRARTGARPVPRGGRYGLYHFAILLPDRAALGRFAAHLSRSQVRVGMADHLVSEALYLTDPDGLGIEVYADRPGGAWRVRGQELVMATDPLDLQDVIAAGADAPWNGVPAGTTMGHMHLHVGRIDKAEAFYHSALGFDKTVWSYPGALFMSAGGYHHHLAVNTWSAGPAAGDDQARLLEWELLVPGDADVAAARSLRAAGHLVEERAAGPTAVDPWGTRVCLRKLASWRDGELVSW